MIGTYLPTALSILVADLLGRTSWIDGVLEVFGRLVDALASLLSRAFLFAADQGDADEQAGSDQADFS